MNLPNLLTLLRVVMIPVFVALFYWADAPLQSHGSLRVYSRSAH